MATTNVQDAQPGDVFIDFAQELTDQIAAAAAAAGVDGIMQYTPYDNTGRAKYGSAKEAAIAHKHGLYYMLNWEIQSDRALQGYTVGRSDGARNRAALRAMGYPEQVSAPVSVDMNTLFSNKDAVTGFVRGHWETDGDQAENIAYLDTDGGHLLELQGLDPRIWIPGAFSWSPELYALSRQLQAQGLTQSARYDRIATLAAENPLAVAIQFPSTTAFGINVDFNRVLKPFNVWGPERQIDPQPVEVEPPVVVQPAPPVQSPVVNVPAPAGTAQEEEPVSFIAQSDSKGMALVSFVITPQNVASYRMAGIEGDVANLATIDAASQLPVVHWPDDIYLARAAAAYKG